MGGTQTVTTEARLFSATNQTREQAIDEGEFRLDVLHRINTFETHLPALRDRGDDIDLLVEHLIPHDSRKLDRKDEGISGNAITSLRKYEWPSNIRELQLCWASHAAVCKPKSARWEF